ncbi:hypothetical protein [Hyphomicrobium sp. MC8b]|uniref:hypothetical protein n=1 Tax=Hyphomicrobium sp. MC8b TaxID=300273 RepID=UPI003918BBC4
MLDIGHRRDRAVDPAIDLVQLLKALSRFRKAISRFAEHAFARRLGAKPDESGRRSDGSVFFQKEILDHMLQVRLRLACTYGGRSQGRNPSGENDFDKTHCDNTEPVTRSNEDQYCTLMEG